MSRRNNDWSIDDAPAEPAEEPRCPCCDPAPEPAADVAPVPAVRVGDVREDDAGVHVVTAVVGYACQTHGSNGAARWTSTECEQEFTRLLCHISDIPGIIDGLLAAAKERERC